MKCSQEWCAFCGGVSGLFEKPSQCRYQPAKIEVKTIRADRRYYKLASGDILDMESKTIINRESLQALLNY